jgi:hypothetical protein
MFSSNSCLEFGRFACKEFKSAEFRVFRFDAAGQAATDHAFPVNF